MEALPTLAFILLALLLWRNTTMSRRVAALIASCVFLSLFLLVVYQIANSLTGNGIDASVLYHLRAGIDGAATSDFRPLMISAIAMLVAASALSYAGYGLAYSSTSEQGSKLRSLAAVAVLLVGVSVNPATNDLIALAKKVQMNAVAQGLAQEVPEGFHQVERATFQGNKKNFVLLYLESIERSYFDEAVFPGLMPNLTVLENRARSFTQISQTDETGWTIAGMVASQCGMPLIGFSSGMDSFLPGATCLGDLLDAEGYELTYLGGADLDFGGKGTFYATHGFDQIKGREELKAGLDDPEYLSAWGLYDDSLYEVATQHYDALASMEEPFGLTLLTVDTHHPFGYLSGACGDDVYGDGTNRFLNAVHCADKMAGDFIRHVLNSPSAEETVLIVMSDHFAMPNLAWEQLNSTDRSNLLMLFSPDLEPDLDDKPGTTLDLAPTLLNLIGAQQGRLGYGRNLVSSEPTLRSTASSINGTINEGRSFISAMRSLPSFGDGVKVDSANGRLVLGDRFVNLPALFKADGDLNVTDIIAGVHSNKRLIEHIADLPFDQNFLWVDLCNATALLVPGSSRSTEQYCGVMGTLGTPDLPSVVLYDRQPMSAADLQDFFRRANPSRNYYEAYTAEILRKSQFGSANVLEFEPPGLVGDIAVRSAGYTTGGSWVLNREVGQRVSLLRGLTLLGIAPDKEPVKIGYKDTCAYNGEIFDNVRFEQNLQTTLGANKDRFGAFVLVAHNSVVCYEIDPNLEDLFAGSPFSDWDKLWYEQPYVAVLSGDGHVQEFIGERQTALGVALRDFVVPDYAVNSDFVQRLPRVAHAGGAYNGMTYTNSHQALDANAKDFELFEIDLARTSDGQVVCLHDWSQPFLSASGVISGEPLSLRVFEALAQGHEKFRACTLSSLAQWLRNHDGAQIVMDTKEDAVDIYTQVAREHPDLIDRFIPQIYQPEEYEAVRAIGYQDVIWTLYRYEGALEDALHRISQMELLGLTMGPKWVERDLPRRARQQTGVLSWVHTINSVAEFESLTQAGVAEIYTDFLK